MAAMLMGILVQAADRTIVVRGSKPTPKSKTSVTCQNDSLVVTPAASATVIDVKVRDCGGAVVEHHVLSAGSETTLSLTTSGDEGTTTLEIADDEGTVYEE